MLQVIKAEEVRDGELRWFTHPACSDDDLVYVERRRTAMHVRPLEAACAGSFPLAIVDRPAPTPTAPPALDLDAVEAAVARLIESLLGDRVDIVVAVTKVATVAPALIAEVRALRADKAALIKHIDYNPSLRIRECEALRAELAEIRELIGNTEHESTCAIGPYSAEQNGADCSCTVGAIAAALEAL